MSRLAAYDVTLPEDPARAAVVDHRPGAKRHRWQRKRWLPTFDADALLTLIQTYAPGDKLWIEPTFDIPGGAFMRIDEYPGYRMYTIGLDMSLTAAELSKALYHELEHVHQAQMFATGDAFHTVAAYAAAEGLLSGLGSWYEEQAQNAEDHHYDWPLVRRLKEKS